MNASPQDGVECPECDRTFPSMDHLVDHLTDDHGGLYNWVTRGRPITADGGGVDE